MTEFEGADTKLGPDKHKEYRSGGGVVHYQSGDRLDCKYSAREIIRDGASPDRGSWATLKRHVRYLAGKKRFINRYPWQPRQKALRTSSDANHGNDVKSRKRTHRVASRLGQHTISEIVQGQPLVAISSGESEFYGLVRGAIESQFCARLLVFFDHKVEQLVETDSSAAKGAASRQGVGRRMKHISADKLLIQNLIADGPLKL